jgi:hypothetical protein
LEAILRAPNIIFDLPSKEFLATLERRVAGARASASMWGAVILASVICWFGLILLALSILGA